MQIESFYVIGIDVRTTNQNGQAALDLGVLWGRFFAQGVMDQIPDKVGSDIYAVYTDYEGDHTKPYTAVIGARVASLQHIPAGMVGKSIPAGRYELFTAKGNLHQGAVGGEWVKIWKMPLHRTYGADFEVYGPRASNPQDAEVDIFVGVE